MSSLPRGNQPEYVYLWNWGAHYPFTHHLPSEHSYCWAMIEGKAGNLGEVQIRGIFVYLFLKITIEAAEFSKTVMQLWKRMWSGKIS